MSASVRGAPNLSSFSTHSPPHRCPTHIAHHTVPPPLLSVAFYPTLVISLPQQQSHPVPIPPARKLRGAGMGEIGHAHTTAVRNVPLQPFHPHHPPLFYSLLSPPVSTFPPSILQHHQQLSHPSTTIGDVALIPPSLPHSFISHVFTQRANGNAAATIHPHRTPPRQIKLPASSVGFPSQSRPAN